MLPSRPRSVRHMGRTLGAKFSSRSVELLQNVLSNCCLHHFRKPDPVQPWWCLALSLMLRTQEQTAGPITEITSPSEVEGFNTNAFWLRAIYFPPRFCKNTGPSNFTFRANKLILQFRSNRRVHGEGAECTIACSDFIPRPETNPVTCRPEGNVFNWNIVGPNIRKIFRSFSILRRQ